MLKCTILLPIRYNDGEWVEEGHLASIRDELINLAGGLTYGGIHAGLWKDCAGKCIRDESESYFVCIDADKLNDLRAILQRAAFKLEQDCIYLDYHEVHLDLIRP